MENEELSHEEEDAMIEEMAADHGIEEYDDFV